MSFLTIRHSLKSGLLVCTSRGRHRKRCIFKIDHTRNSSSVNRPNSVHNHNVCNRNIINTSSNSNTDRQHRRNKMLLNIRKCSSNTENNHHHNNIR